MITYDHQCPQKACVLKQKPHFAFPHLDYEVSTNSFQKRFTFIHDISGPSTCGRSSPLTGRRWLFTCILLTLETCSMSRLRLGRLSRPMMNLYSIKLGIMSFIGHGPITDGPWLGRTWNIQIHRGSWSCCSPGSRAL